MTTAERFWPKVDRRGPDECWEWCGCVHPNGYGKFRMHGKTHWAHRAAYELAYGPMPPGLYTDHLCRNHRCVNPAHLEAVTPKENSQRAVRKEVTACKRGHPYPENQYVNQPGHLRCRICQREQNRASYYRNKPAPGVVRGGTTGSGA